MNQADFGSHVDFASFLTESLEHLPAVSPTIGWLYLLERYETAFGIFNHDMDNNSLGIMLMHEAEDTLEGSLLRRRMRQYLEHDVLKFFGLDFTDFLAQPRYVLEEMLKACTNKQRDDLEDERRRQRKIEALEKK